MKTSRDTTITKTAEEKAVLKEIEKTKIIVNSMLLMISTNTIKIIIEIKKRAIKEKGKDRHLAVNLEDINIINLNIKRSNQVIRNIK